MERNNKINTAIGAGAGFGTYIAASRLSRYAIGKTLTATSINLTDEQISRMNNAVRRMANGEHFNSRKIKVIDGSTEEYRIRSEQNYYKHLNELAQKIKDTKNPFEKVKLIFRKRRYSKEGLKSAQAVQAGLNAYYNQVLNCIVVNMQKGVHMFFHETGHALDFSNPILKAYYSLGKNRLFTKYLPLVTLGSALLTPSVKERKPKNLSEKLNAFFKKHCGVLATLGFLPMLTSELSANIKGQQLAKKYADKIDLKTLTKSHLHSAAGYCLLPITIGLSVHCANKVSDKIREKLNKKN